MSRVVRPVHNYHIVVYLETVHSHKYFQECNEQDTGRHWGEYLDVKSGNEGNIKIDSQEMSCDDLNLIHQD